MPNRYSPPTAAERDGRWVLRCRRREVAADGSEGPWRTLTKSTGEAVAARTRSWAEAEAWAWRDGLVAAEAVRSAGVSAGEELDRRLGIDREALSRPFADYARDYVRLQRIASSGAEAGGSAGGNADVLRLWVLPFLPHAEGPVSGLTGEDVRLMLAGLDEAGYSAATISKAYGLLKSVVRHAVNVDGLRPDPTYGIRRTKRARPRINFLDPTQADGLARTLAAARQTEAVCAARLALAAGLELEASCGLQVRDCDPAAADAIHVTKCVGRRRGTWAVVPPKNEYRDRVVPLNDELRQVVRARLAEWASEHGRLPGPDDWLLASPGARQYPFSTPARVRREWRRSRTASASGAPAATG